MHRITRALITSALGLATLALVVAAGLTALWPLHADGVSGSAVAPHYRDFGFVTFQPLPATPTRAQLRAAGVRLPHDVVDHRRHIAYALSGVGLAALLGLATTQELRRRAGA